ncbi:MULTISPECIES: NADase-type glycan-binding domain-containing protein [Nitratireductor]|uniref:NADase-type glycan-binding domain-containing protein n=1 Tax=Nitratireductor TaxID=245876 RepID=UPI000D0D0470|nr:MULTISPECIES: hypothetical protein [Nitratireductor]PSM15911.1 hypothetical protein C7T96_22845 [Nitratireductor sp. StC3]
MKRMVIWLVGGVSMLGALPFGPAGAEAGQLCATTRLTQAFETQSICVSSARQPRGGTVYDIRSLTDWDDATAWCVDGDGIGESIIVRLEDAAPPENFWIRNGYAKSQQTFRNHARIRTMELVAFSYGLEQPQRRAEIVLGDNATEQTIALPWRVADPRYFELRITSVYPGQTDEDLCVTGFSVDYGM